MINNFNKTLFLLGFVLCIPHSVDAAYFYTEPASDVLGGYEYTIPLKIDTEGEDVSTADALMSFNPDYMTVTGVSAPAQGESILPKIIHNVDHTKGQLYVGTHINLGEQPVKGASTIAYIHIRSFKAGQSSLSFLCTEGKTTESNISVKRDGKVVDLIDCSKNRNFSFTNVIGNLSGPHLYLHPGIIRPPEDSPYLYLGVGVDTRGSSILTTDSLISYNPSLMLIRRVFTYDPTSSKFPAAGDLKVATYIVDTERGEISIPAITESTRKSFSGKGLFAVIEYQPIKPGHASFLFRCIPGQTNESNVIENSQNANDIIDCTDVGPYVIDIVPKGPIPTDIPKNCEDKLPGDFNCDGRISLADFEVWRQKFIAGEETLAGFERFRNAFTNQ